MTHNKPRSLPDGLFNDTMQIMGHKVMMYMALKRGLKQYGVRGEEVVSTKLMQIHMQNMFKPQHYADLTQVQRRKAFLESLLFLDEKKTGAIKGRMCADSSKQQIGFAKGEATLPTVTTDAVIITSAINANENRDVTVIDLPGAFLHADMYDVVHMVVRGQLAKLMTEMAPELYRKYITYGKKWRRSVICNTKESTIRLSQKRSVVLQEVGH